MTLSLLIDLDDTLLSNNIHHFLPEYLKLLSQHFPGIAPEAVITHLMAATQEMIKKTSPVSSLEETFDSFFYPALGTTKEEMLSGIDDFYANVFPSLRKFTSPKKDSQALIQFALEEGYDIAVATNPVFPATAIHQRLEWADLPIEHNHFKLISNFTDFHFTKPNAAFFAEVMAQLGCKNQPAVMMGDSLIEDILPASKLGLPVFWVIPSGSLPEGLHPLSQAGDLKNAKDWLKKVADYPFEFSTSTDSSITATLAATPAALDTLVKKVPQKFWKVKPQPGEWCLNEIICHLRDVDMEINLPRLGLIQREDNPFLPGVSSDEWATERKYCQQDGKQALRDFCAARAELLSQLRTMDRSSWKKPARHAIFGPTYLQELTGFMATHDRNHIQQAFPLLTK